MPKPFHVIATPDENGYTVTIPENPNVSARCVDAADIIPIDILYRMLVLLYFQMNFASCSTEYFGTQ